MSLPPMTVEKCKLLMAHIVGRAVEDLAIMREAGYINGDATDRHKIWEDSILYSAWHNRDASLLSTIRRLARTFPAIPRRRVIQLTLRGRRSAGNPVGHKHFREFEDAASLVQWFRGRPLEIACEVMGVDKAVILRKVQL